MESPRETSAHNMATWALWAEWFPENCDNLQVVERPGSARSSLAPTANIEPRLPVLVIFMTPACVVGVGCRETTQTNALSWPVWTAPRGLVYVPGGPSAAIGDAVGFCAQTDQTNAHTSSNNLAPIARGAPFVAACCALCLCVSVCLCCPLLVLSCLVRQLQQLICRWWPSSSSSSILFANTSAQSRPPLRVARNFPSVYVPHCYGWRFFRASLVNDIELWTRPTSTRATRPHQW